MDLPGRVGADHWACMMILSVMPAWELLWQNNMEFVQTWDLNPGHEGYKHVHLPAELQRFNQYIMVNK